MLGSVATTFSQIFGGPEVWAQTWNKITAGSGAANTWRKLQPATTTSAKFSLISSSHFASHAVRADGVLYATGSGSYGMLGDGTTTARSTFAQVASVSNVVGLGGGWGSTFLVRADGTVWSTGVNSNGQLGDNTGTSRSTFVQAIGISNAVAVAGGWYHTLALRADGNVFGAGYNGTGQLGQNNLTNDYSTFVQAIGISNAIGIACGYRHSIALRADGFVYTCGDNSYGGPLGDNTTTGQSTFIQAIGISNAIAVAAHNLGLISLALRRDGLVFGCGANGYGNIGDNSTTSRLTFVQALGISNAVAIACGQTHSLALRADGRVFATGSGGSGQLGTGSTANRSTFTQAVGLSNIIAIACGQTHSLALRADGVIFGTGGGTYIGEGSATVRSSFVQALGT